MFGRFFRAKEVPRVLDELRIRVSSKLTNSPPPGLWREDGSPAAVVTIAAQFGVSAAEAARILQRQVQ